MSENEDTKTAYSALRKLVIAEYPANLSLYEIASTWGEDITGEELAALKRLEGE